MKNIQTDIIDKLTPDIINKMKKIHFIADLHHSHSKIVDICERPTTREEHNEWLLREVFNKHIGKKDEVYILGDVSFANKIEAQKFVAQLNGNKHLIDGNHDKSVKKLGNWQSISQIKDFTFSHDNLNIHIVLCHYPISSWNRKIHGSWHLYGHVHGRFMNTGLSWDVGMDNRQIMGGVSGWLRPLNLYDICIIMNELQKRGKDNDYTETQIEME